MKALLPPLRVVSGGLAGAAQPASLADALAPGKVAFQARLRYGGVEQAPLRDAPAFPKVRRIWLRIEFTC